MLRYFRIAADRPVVIAASTLKGEEEPVLEAFQRIRATMTERAADHRAAQARAVRRGRAAGAPRPAGTSRAARELRVDAEPRDDVVILDAADCEAVVRQCRMAGRDHVACVVLGRGADHAAVDNWLRAARGVDGYCGFAIGRSIWWDPLKAYVDGALPRAQAAQKIGQNYHRFVNVYEQN